MRSFEEEQRRERRREPARRDGDLRDGALVPTVYGSPMPAETSFLGVHLAVADMAAAMAFYRLAGLPVPDGADGEGHVQLDVGGGVHIAFSTPAVIGMYDPGWRGPSTATATVLQLRLASRQAVNDMYASLTEAGYRGHLPPIDAFWGNRYCEVDDPDGNAVGFQSPTDDARRA